MKLESCVGNLSNALNDLRRIDLGYPIGDNLVVPAPEHRDPVALLEAEGVQLPDLSDFYRLCDGLRMPDVRNGYFLKSLSELIRGIREKEPAMIVGHMDEPILVIGSTGGGHRFVISRSSRAILMLGNGLVVNRTFKADGRNVSVVSDGLIGFLEKVLADVAAFIADRRDHDYIA